MLFVDQLNKHIQIHKTPMRIVSLIPSQSEYLWDLGLKSQLVGISKFCIHPHQMYETITRVGGTKQLDINKIKALKPDLIIGNKEENVKEQIEELQRFFPVWMSDVNTLDEAYDMMLKLGEICGKKTESEAMVDDIKTRMATVNSLFKQKSVAYFIWNDPYMVAASHTFIDSVLNYCGLTNYFGNLSRYPEIQLPQLAHVDYCFLSSEPFPFGEAHKKEIQLHLPKVKVILVDGEMFSWYGSRLLNLPNYLIALNKQLND